MSERGFSATIENALGSTEVHGAFLVYLNWPSGAARFWSGMGQLSWNGFTWSGVGTLGAIDKIADSIEKTDIGVELSLNYLDDGVRNEVNTNDPTGRDASIYIAIVDPATRTVTDAYELFAGYIDQVDMEDGGASGRIIVRLASELALLNRSTYYTLTHAHQQQLFPGDLGMQFASRMDEVIMWGRKPLAPYVPGMPSTPPAVDPYPGYNDQYLFPLAGSQ